jgi:predicted ATPase
MKLRYLYLRNYPPINSVRIAFASNSPLARECAIRFVVGVNGSGKSHLLQAIGEVFIALADWLPPHFPVSLVYEIGKSGNDLAFNQPQNMNRTPGRTDLVLNERAKKTIILSALREDGHEQPALWASESFTFSPVATADEFDALVAELYANPERLPHGFRAIVAPGTWTGKGATAEQGYLPQTVLAYTTGAPAPWEALWHRNTDSEGVDLISQAEDYDVSRERPVGWTAAQERKKLAQETDTKEHIAATTSDILTPEQYTALTRGTAWSPILITPELLKFALLAVALPVGLKDIIANDPAPDDEYISLRKLLGRAGWRWPVSVAVTVDFHPEAWKEPWREERLRRLLPWFHAAGEVISQPHPSTARTLHFDLRGVFDPTVLPDDIGDDLRSLPDNTQGHALLSMMGGEKNSSAYERFQRLLDLHEEGLIAGFSICLRKDDTDDLIHFEELSDGEQMVLGRMALFHLLAGQQDALLLLDEPETHFNDKWKREIVDIIDEAIGTTANDVLISTHSAIVLSDVFNNEIVMVQKTADGSTIRSVTEQTFATDPSALMMTVFEANDSIGKRAQEFIEEKLRKATGTADDIQKLEQLITRMGSGFYRSELRTLLNKWKGGGNA